MNQNRLFNVLVMGGLAALSSAPSFADSFSSGFEVGHGSAQIQETSFEDTDPAHFVFCENEAVKKEVCETLPSGEKGPKKGFVCCWGTSCE